MRSQSLDEEMRIRAHGHSGQAARIAALIHTKRTCLMATALPLMTLQDGRAPYKGVWRFVEAAPGSVQAIHDTFHPNGGPCCEIERWDFGGRESATHFARHLILHGWGLRDLHEEGEHFWIHLPG
jgi:hypothetical protein